MVLQQLFLPLNFEDQLNCSQVCSVDFRVMLFFHSIPTVVKENIYYYYYYFRYTVNSLMISVLYMYIKKKDGVYEFFPESAEGVKYYNRTGLSLDFKRVVCIYNQCIYLFRISGVINV